MIAGRVLPERGRLICVNEPDTLADTKNADPHSAEEARA